MTAFHRVEVFRADLLVEFISGLRTVQLAFLKKTATRVTGANRNTIKDHVRALTNAGPLSRHGAGRGTWYALS